GELIGPFSAILFGVALLFSGIASSTVGTMAGDVIMQGYINRRIPIYLRRTITIIPPLIVIGMGVDSTLALVISQIILSFGIPFALIPLIIFTSKKRIMGSLVNHKLTTFIAWIIALVIIALNIFLLAQTIPSFFN
ncbi:MAG: Nramp family divalent metal transporter, partial [Solibacillus sp.]